MQPPPLLHFQGNTIADTTHSLKITAHLHLIIPDYT
jgi:hypothetical protein